MRETEKFRTECLVVRPWQIEDLPLAMELWGDRAVTALIDSRGKLTNAQVGEKLRAEIERERSDGVQYWTCSITAMASSSAAAGFGRGCIRPARRISKSGSIS